jgi:uncharacterized protein
MNRVFKKDRSRSKKLPISHSKRWLIRARRFAIGYSIFCTLLFFQQQRLMFFPFRNYPHTPDLYQLKYQDVWLPITTKSGKVDRLHGWWIPAEKLDAPVMLYFHHNAVNIGANVSQARQFHKLGYSILLIDYRGFGQSEGDFPTELQVYEDAQAAWNYLTQDRKMSAKQIVIYGHSIGGAVAIDLAAKHPDAAALIVQSTFTSMRDMSKRFGVFWVLPIDLLIQQHFKSLEKMKSVQMPVLIIQGTSDFQIPVEMGQALYAAAPKLKQLLLIENGGHDNNMPEKYTNVVKQFIQTTQVKSGG